MCWLGLLPLVAWCMHALLELFCTCALSWTSTSLGLLPLAVWCLHALLEVLCLCTLLWTSTFLAAGVLCSLQRHFLIVLKGQPTLPHRCASVSVKCNMPGAPSTVTRAGNLQHPACQHKAFQTPCSSASLLCIRCSPKHSACQHNSSQTPCSSASLLQWLCIQMQPRHDATSAMHYRHDNF